jgi:uncharacterized membrane protein YqjE
MPPPAESVREHTSDLAARLVRLREWLAGLAEDQVAELSTRVRAETRRAVLALAFALAVSFFVCAAAVLGIVSLFIALWDGHRLLAGALAMVLFALLALASFVGLSRVTRAAVRERGAR